MIRELKIEDANLMLDWMKNEEINKNFNIDFSKLNLNDCEKFIEENINNYNNEKPENLNFAIADEAKKYKGTISLKNIDYNNKCAEFAIVLVRDSHGSGLAKDSFDRIIEYAFNILDLKFIYFSCKKENIIANKFYSKTIAKLIDVNSLLAKIGGRIKGYDEIHNNLNWYIVYQ